MSSQIYLNKYRVERFLADGGMSYVYLGRQLDLDRDVVIKVVRKELAKQIRAVAHFRREIHIMSRFAHPHAVTFFDADAEADAPVLVMEFCHGLDLSQLLEKGSRFSFDRLGNIIGQLCQVLHAAHEMGIVHQDLKPSNVMLLHPDSPAERVKLMDFGLAKMSSLFFINEQDLSNDYDLVACGTPEYMAPEQARGNDVDRRSDIYSLGVMMYELLAGRRPFEGEDTEQLLLSHVSDPVPSFSQLRLRRSIPEELEDIVMSCLAKYPEERPETVEEVALRLEELLGRKIYSQSANNSRGGQRSTAGLSRATVARLNEIDNGKQNGNLVCCIQAQMHEAMAMLKLKGFIHDVGGEVVSSTPGYVRVQLPLEKASGGFLGLWGKKAAKSVDLELRVETEDASRPNDLSIRLYVRNPEGYSSPESQNRCEILSRELKAYLR